jgi:hypothetical protein
MIIITVSSSQKSDFQYTSMPPPINQDVINLIVSLPTRNTCECVDKGIFYPLRYHATQCHNSECHNVNLH